MIRSADDWTEILRHRVGRDHISIVGEHALRDLAHYRTQGAYESDDCYQMGNIIEAAMRLGAETALENAALPRESACARALREAADRLQGAAEAIEMAFPPPNYGQETAAQLRAWANEARAALAASPSPDAEEGWRPIETAPKDGTRILTFSPDAAKLGLSTIRINVWRTDMRSWWHTNAEHWPPTHWRPMPPPPGEPR